MQRFSRGAVCGAAAAASVSGTEGRCGHGCLCRKAARPWEVLGGGGLVRDTRRSPQLRVRPLPRRRPSCMSPRSTY